MRQVEALCRLRWSLPLGCICAYDLDEEHKEHLGFSAELARELLEQKEDDAS